jgi:hypothetical protein
MPGATAPPGRRRASAVSVRGHPSCSRVKHRSTQLVRCGGSTVDCAGSRHGKWRDRAPAMLGVAPAVDTEPMTLVVADARLDGALLRRLRAQAPAGEVVGAVSVRRAVGRRTHAVPRVVAGVRGATRARRRASDLTTPARHRAHEPVSAVGVNPASRSGHGTAACRLDAPHAVLAAAALGALRTRRARGRPRPARLARTTADGSIGVEARRLTVARQKQPPEE